MTPIQFSQQGMQLLQARSLTGNEIKQFSNILADAKQHDGFAKDFLNSLSAQDLELVRKANSLADTINIEQLTKEGAQNLLARPDGTGLVDLNNDGIVEVGVAKTIHFPPVNAPQFVKDAWEASTDGMSEGDKAILMFRMHIQIYGLQIDGGPQKNPLPPEQQWNDHNIEQLFKQLYANLEFEVGQEGWTKHNRASLEFYKKFAAELKENATKTASTVAQKSLNSAQSNTQKIAASLYESDLKQQIKAHSDQQTSHAKQR
ncbi:hypothetical protein ACSLBF_17000 [Pseudoalteromonas sp. T1lg65]|uniref:hypothetical protein n=1 Tax=Pseudoalteromonas sp. T1lg65 TaxID=2077101 RepID=UPI003F79F357